MYALPGEMSIAGGAHVHIQHLPALFSATVHYLFCKQCQAANNDGDPLGARVLQDYHKRLAAYFWDHTVSVPAFVPAPTLGPGHVGGREEGCIWGDMQVHTP